MARGKKEKRIGCTAWRKMLMILCVTNWEQAAGGFMNWDNLGNLLKAGVFSSRKASTLIAETTTTRNGVKTAYDARYK